MWTALLQKAGKMRQALSAEESEKSSSAEESKKSLSAEYIEKIRAQLANYKHAFETTASDRNRIKSNHENLQRGMEFLLSTLPDNRAMPKLSNANRLLSKPEISSHFSSADLQNFSKKTLPNIYCVGAPKTATSFLYSILRDHPSVAVSRKDFSGISDLCAYYNESNDWQHTSFLIKRFITLQNEKYSCEPTLCLFNVDAFMMANMADFIHGTLCEDARILMMLRNPVKRAISEFRMRVLEYNQSEGCFVEQRSFADAVNSEVRDWTDGAHYTFNDLNLRRCGYIRNGQYAKFVEPFLKTFNSENIKAVIFEEDILSSLEKTIFDTFQFIGIKDLQSVQISVDDHSYFSHISKAPESIVVEFADQEGNAVDLNAPDLIDNNITRIEVTSSGGASKKLAIDSPSKEVIVAASTLVKRHNVNLSTEQESEIYHKYFKDDVSRLEDLLGRDLSVWYSAYL